MKKSLSFYLIFSLIFFLSFSLVEAQTQNPFQFTAQFQKIIEQLQALIKQLQEIQETQKPTPPSKPSFPTPPLTSTPPLFTPPQPLTPSSLLPSLPSKGKIILEELPGSPEIPCSLPPLSINSRNNSVYLLQMILNKSGYYPEGLITGYYGRLTKGAVERFQKAQGLPVTGQIDEKTSQALNNLVRKYYPEECQEIIQKPGEPIDVLFYQKNYQNKKYNFEISYYGNTLKDKEIREIEEEEEENEAGSGHVYLSYYSGEKIKFFSYDFLGVQKYCCPFFDPYNPTQYCGQEEEIKKSGFKIENCKLIKSDIDEVAREKAYHKLQPFGEDPFIKSIKISNQEARIIESKDPKNYPEVWMIINLPEPVKIKNYLYNFLVLYTSQDYKDQILKSFKFIK